MPQLKNLAIVVLLATLISGCYGIVHDQISYSVSPEYYTKLKFYQFGFAPTREEWVPHFPRLYAGAVGFLASWWLGPPIGLILGLVNWRKDNQKLMRKITVRALLMALLIAFVIGLLGLLGGWLLWLSMKDEPLNFNLGPIDDPGSFLSVMIMHNASYAGGVIGLIGGIIYSLVRKRREKKQQLLSESKED